MIYISSVESDAERERFCAVRVHEALLSPAAAVRHRPDASLMATSEGGEVVARCSLWWTEAPELPGHRAGVVGHYAATDAAAAGELLDRACEQLGAQKCTIAVGPMDGNTWRRYRLVTERGDEPPFFLEPDNPDDWPAHWRDAGFETLARYSSTLAPRLDEEDPRMARVAERLDALGVAIRPLRVESFEEELSRIYAVSEVSFRRNFLYTPIGEAEFVEQYLPVRPHVVPDLVSIAEHEGRAVGFLFALPDLLQTARGRAVDTAIVKTVAVLPGRDYAGLGNLLVARCHQTARGLGFSRAIHALMHDANNSRNLSEHYATTMRRYELFSRAL